MISYTLSELSGLIEEAIVDAMPDLYWVRAEIASLSRKGGHLYMDLVEKGERGILSAKQRATCWAQQAAMLTAYFEHETGASLAPGMQVLLEVTVSYHPVYGLSLNVIGIDPTYTVGELMQARQRVIRQLTEEGVIDMQHMLTLPTLTRRLAVITSDSAAGWEDFRHQLEESPYAFSLTLYPAVVQGDRAESSMLEALEQILHHEADYDAVVIIRGGGATTDMSCFDGYTLCACCAQFPLPVLTGVGHTRDVSVLDLVAYEALKTPTAVAAWLIARMDNEWQRIEALTRRLAETERRQLLIREHRIQLLEQRLAACSPERIYRMGYSLTLCDGKPVRDASAIAPGTLITTQLLSGTLHSVTT